MAVIEVSGVPAGAPSSFTLPLTGRPWADLTLAVPTVAWKQGDRVEVTVQDGPTHQMTVERAGPRGGFARLRLIGGTGGLGREVTARYYRDLPAERVLRELLTDCGETVGTLRLPGRLPAWARLQGPAHEALRTLMMRYPERVWRMNPDGRVDVGVPQWPEHGPPLPVEAEDAAAGTFTCEFRPSLLPGEHVTLTRGEEEIGKRVTRVTHRVEEVYGYPRAAVRVRTLVGTGDGEDGGVSGLEASVRRVMRFSDYHAMYPAEVITDHGNHTLDVTVLAPGWPPLTRVPLLVRVPGVRVRVKKGSPLLLSFEQGDPARPVAECRDTASLEYVEVRTVGGVRLRLDDALNQVDIEAGLVNVKGDRVVLAGGGPPVARLGDTVQVSGVMPGGGTAVGTITSGSGKVTSG